MDKLIAALLLLCLSARADSSLIVWLNFENNFTASLRADDSSGWTNHAYIPYATPLTFSGTYASNWVSGQSGHCFQQVDFGTAEYAAIVVANGGNTNSFPGYETMSRFAVTNMGGGLQYLTNGTVACWLNPAQTEAQNPSMTVVDAGWPGTSNSWAISSFFNESGSRLAFTRMTNSSTTPQDLLITFPSLATNAWTHIAVVWDGGANQIIGYTNGVPFQTNTMRAPYFQVAPAASGPPWIAIACLTHDGGAFDVYQVNNGWLGQPSKIDDFRIYARALSAAEVKGLFVGVPAITATIGGATIGKASIGQ